MDHSGFQPLTTVASALVLALLSLAGCSDGAGADRSGPDAGPADDPRQPDLPIGISLDGGREVARTRTSATFEWSGTVLALSGVGVRPAEAATLDLPATVPLQASFSLAHESVPDPDGLRATMAFSVLDEHGRQRCVAYEDRPCTVSWVRPVGSVRTWGLQVSALVVAGPEVPFTATVAVETLGHDGPVPADVPASLAEVVPFEVASDDGNLLRGHVYLPEGDGPFPTVLEFSPYWNTIQGQGEGKAHEAPDGRTTMLSRLGPFLDDGYAVALVNLRGTGESDGCKAFFGPQDGTDAYHVIQGLAEQPWSNGNVGMVGISWSGYSQYAALREQPPALKAVVPSSAILDQWNLWTRYGASLSNAGLPLAYTFGFFLAATAVGVERDFSAGHLACPSHLEHAQAYLAMSQTGDKSDWLRERDMHDVIANSTVPMLVTNGLHPVLEGHILQAEGLWPLMPEESRLVLGQWGHQYPHEETPRTEAWDQEVLGFLGHYLKGEEKTVATGVVAYEDTLGTWRTATSWPPPGKAESLHLSAGSLVASPKDVEPSVATFASPNVPAEFTPEPAACPYQALYVSPPLAKDVLLAGNFQADLTVSATAPNGNFAVYLYHGLGPQPCTFGDPQPSGLGIAEVGRAVSDLRHRGHLPQGSDFPVGSPDLMEMSSYPFAEFVPAGHRLMLVVAGTSPDVEPKATQPAITVATGPGIVGEVTLNVVEGQLRFEGDGEGGEGGEGPLPALGLPPALP